MLQSSRSFDDDNLRIPSLVEPRKRRRGAWRTTLAGLVALLSGFGLMQTGNTLQGTLLSVRGGIEGFSPAEIGAVGAAFWAGVVIGALCGGSLIRRVGHIRTFAALGAIASTAPLLHLLMLDPVAWIAARALTGFCFAGLFIVVESWLNGAASGETRGQILSIYSMTGLIAGVGGQLMLPLVDPAGYRGFCIIATIIAFALVPIALTRSQSPGAVDSLPRSSLRALYAKAPFGMVAALLCGATTGAFFALGPVFAQRRGLDATGIAILMASGTLGGFLMAWPLGWLSDHIDRRVVVIGVAITAAASLFIMINVVPMGAAPDVLYVCVALLGASIVPTYSIVIAQVNDAVAKNEFVAASSCLLLVQGTGAAAGPAIAGFAMATWEHGLGYTLITAQLLIAGWGVYRLGRTSLRSRHHGVFLIEPPVPVAATLAPAHLGSR
jgi:MFS family permease